MGQLHQMNRHLVWILALIAPSALNSAQSYCSLTVRVFYPDGQPADAVVSVHEKSGRVESIRQEGAEVRFCDLGALPVTVKVGPDGTCNQVVVENVPMGWNLSRRLTITYDVDPCLAEKPPPPAPICRMVFRIADTSGKWISGVPIKLSAPASTSLLADQYGRASILIKVGEQVTGSVERQGYATAQFSATCTQSEPVHEELLRLKEQNGLPGQ
jgi:hypothetical protein